MAGGQSFADWPEQIGPPAIRNTGTNVRLRNPFGALRGQRRAIPRAGLPKIKMYPIAAPAIASCPTRMRDTKSSDRQIGKATRRMASRCAVEFRRRKHRVFAFVCQPEQGRRAAEKNVRGWGSKVMARAGRPSTRAPRHSCTDDLAMAAVNSRRNCPDATTAPLRAPASTVLCTNVNAGAVHWP